ncbi:hypothetical protein EB001_19330 [bacterium]|nr:hypothetical protein [bacterium]
MNKLIVATVLLGSIIFTSYRYEGDTTSVATLVGSIIKSHQSENAKKYNRKDCPVCKGKGWYISGDGIKKVECGYCEPPKQQVSESEVVHPPIMIRSPNRRPHQ